MEDSLNHLLQELQESQQQLVDAIRPFAQHQDWRLAPTEWSFREVAAHLATTEEECFMPRVHDIVADSKPHFSFYHNNERDFSHIDLNDSLTNWISNRHHLIALLQNLPQIAWTYTATHDTFGLITLKELLGIIIEHDRGHLNEMTPMFQAADHLL